MRFCNVCGDDRHKTNECPLNEENDYPDQLESEDEDGKAGQDPETD